MSAEELDRVCLPQRELAQAALVPEALPAIRFHQRLVGAQPGRTAVAAGVHLPVEEIGVAAVQERTRRRLHRDAGVPARVARQRHQQHLVVQAEHRTDAIEVEPMGRQDLQRKGRAHLFCADHAFQSAHASRRRLLSRFPVRRRELDPRGIEYGRTIRDRKQECRSGRRRLLKSIRTRGVVP